MTECERVSVRLIVVGGFFAAGKTTTVLRLADFFRERGQRVGVVANDQASDLVDTGTFRSAGLQTAEVAGGCFCCRFDDFVARAGELIEAGDPAVIIAEPVGSCTDLVATVINPLRRLHRDRFHIAPFTVLVDPLRALKLLGGAEPIGLSPRVTYIYRMQQQEADAIAINKIDRLEPAERARVRELVGDRCPGREVFEFSARTGEGFDRWLSWMDANAAAGAAVSDVDYGIYAEGEAELGWLNSRVALEAAAPLAIDDSVMSLGRAIQEALAAARLEIAHAKMWMTANGRDAVVNIVDATAPPELSRRSETAATALALTINVRAQADPLVLADLVRRGLQQWTETHGLTIVSGSGECFKPPPPVPTHRMPTDAPPAV